MAGATALEIAPIFGPVNGSILARISYGKPEQGALAIPVRQINGEPRIENWPECPGMIFGAVAIDDATPLDTVTRDAYSRLIEGVRAARHPHFLRMWNYLGSINESDDGRERYQLFCAGRHDAFRDAGWGNRELPAASAVGIPGRGLITYFLASDEPGKPIENPRQVSAYRYPPRYGPKSPSFSRAMLWGDTLFVSGTSSVVGHETLHAGDVEAQLEETLRNLEAVIGKAAHGGSLADVVAAKTYLRHAADYSRISRRLSRVLPVNLVLESDICRRDLLIEIEAVARI